MPSGAAMSMIALVIWMSACDGEGSPEGWLCTRIIVRFCLLISTSNGHHQRMSVSVVALVEKQTAAKMTSALIVVTPFTFSRMASK